MTPPQITLVIDIWSSGNVLVRPSVDPVNMLIMQQIGTKVSVPAEHVASMKAGALNIPWNQMSERWMKTLG